MLMGTKGIYVREQIKAESRLFAAAFQVSATGLQWKKHGFLGETVSFTCTSGACSLP